MTTVIIGSYIHLKAEPLPKLVLGPNLKAIIKKYVADGKDGQDADKVGMLMIWRPV